MNNSAGSVLAFDIGLKRTGVAVGQSLLNSANPAGQLSVERGRHNWQQLDQLMQQWQPQVVVVGDPKTQDPALKKCINRFKSHLQQHHKVRIVEIDETLSSSAANLELAERDLSLNKKIELRDQIAACLILESYWSEKSIT